MSLILKLDSRSYAILIHLLDAVDYRTTSDLVRTTHQPRRTIYYSLCKINDWLDSQQLPHLEYEPSRGIFIPVSQREMIRAVLRNPDEENCGYIYTPLERVRMIICTIIQSETPVFIETLAVLCEVDHSTVVSDLKTVAGKLQKYSLELHYENKKGYTILGDTICRRALFLFYFGYLSSIFESGIPQMFNRVQISEYYRTLLKLEEDLNTRYVSGTLLALAILLPTMHSASQEISLRDVEQGEIETTREFLLVKKYFPLLSVPEQCYLALHLLGSRLQSIPARLLRPDQDKTLHEMVTQLVKEFERIACVELEEKSALERALFAHLKTSLYRYRYGIQFGNPYVEDIIREYPSLFRITRSATQCLEKKIGLPILDGEVAYLTMHFGGFLRSVNKESYRLRILVVCPNGVSTGNMLRSEIAMLLPHARIVDVVVSLNALNINSVCDLVVSTVSVKCNTPVVVVHPILTNEDRITILQCGMNGRVSSTGELLELEPLFATVSKYVPVDDHTALREDLMKHLHNRHKSITTGLSPEKSIGLTQILTKERIEIFEEDLTWREAVQVACGTLIEKESITQHYMDSILLSLEVYGPYMFLSPGLILAHAKPSDGTNRLDISISIFHKKVNFGDDHFAQVLFVLSPVDGESHLGILKDILAIFSVHKNVSALASCETACQVFDFIHDRCVALE